MERKKGEHCQRSWSFYPSYLPEGSACGNILGGQEIRCWTPACVGGQQEIRSKWAGQYESRFSREINLFQYFSFKSFIFYHSVAMRPCYSTINKRQPSIEWITARLKVLLRLDLASFRRTHARSLARTNACVMVFTFERLLHRVWYRERIGEIEKKITNGGSSCLLRSKIQ